MSVFLSEYGTSGGDPSTIQSSRTGTLQRDYTEVDYAVPDGASPGINIGVGSLPAVQTISRAVPLVNLSGFRILPQSGSLGPGPVPPRSLTSPVAPSSIPPVIVGVGIALVIAGAVAVAVLSQRKGRR